MSRLTFASVTELERRASRPAQIGTELREHLVANGLVRPAVQTDLTPLRLPEGTPVLRLDHAGRVAAARHVREGLGRVLERVGDQLL